MDRGEVESADRETSFAGIKETNTSKIARRLGGKRNFIFKVLFLIRSMWVIIVSAVLMNCETW